MLSKICCFNIDISKLTCCSLTRNRIIKIGYLLILALAYSILFLINSKVQNLTQDTIQSYGCFDQYQGADQYECVKNKNAEAVFTGVAIMHLILMCSMFCKSQRVTIINEGLWAIKILIAALICLFLRLLVGSQFFQYIGYFSVWATNLIYFFMTIVFIDLVYVFDDFLDDCALQNNKIYILKAIISIALVITASFICFLNFYHNPAYVCWTNAICLVVFIILAFLKVFPGNSVLVSALISLFINITGYYIKGENDELEKQNEFFIIIKGLFLLFLLLGMLCQGSKKLRTTKQTLNQLFALSTNANEEEDNRYVSIKKWAVYHYVMIIIAATIPIVICWSEQGNSKELNEWINASNLTWWIASILLYIWSLICSKLFPEKDFNDLQNYFRHYQLQ